jgi:cytochrome P450
MQSGTIPAINKIPFLGNILELRYNRLVLFMKIAETCGDIGAFYVGSAPVVMLNSSEFVRQVLVEHAASIQGIPVIIKQLRPLLGNGLLTTDGEIHRHQRKMLNPFFRSNSLVKYTETMTYCATELARSLMDKEVVDVAQEMMNSTLKIAIECFFEGDLSEDISALTAAFTCATQYLSDRTTTLYPIPSSWPSKKNRAFHQAMQTIEQIIQRIVDNRKRSKEKRDDLLSLLIEQQSGENGDPSIHDQIKTILFAGHETTANALSWTCYLLVKHPDTYQRMVAEIDHVLAGQAPTYADLSRLPYVAQVLKEALRLYPPVYILQRQTIAPITVGPYDLPEGTAIGISPYVLHRQAQYFPQPYRFDPDRFASDSEQQIPRYAYLPFGAGSHACIGSAFALLEAQLILIRLVQHMTFELAPGHHVEPEPLITLRPRGAMNLRVRRREGVLVAR